MDTKKVRNSATEIRSYGKPSRKLKFMAHAKQPTSEQIPVLEDLHEASLLRNLAYSLYLSTFTRALDAGAGPSLIARYAKITPQAANSTRNRLEAVPPDDDAPDTVDEVLRRLKESPPPARPRRRRR